MNATPDKTVKVLLVDDLPIVRIGIKALLAPIADVQLVGEADDGQEAVAAVDNLNPDIIIMDVGMPVMNGIDAARTIRVRNKTAKIIMLTSHDRESDIFAAFAAGADGYVLKDGYASTLELAMRTVRFGSVWLDPAIAKRVLELAASQRDTSPVDIAVHDSSLTDKERDVLDGVAESSCDGGLCMIEPGFLEGLRRFAKAKH